MISAVDHAVHAVRERLRMGRLVLGQRLVGANLMRESGVGRNVVREALSMLRSDEIE